MSSFNHSCIYSNPENQSLNPKTHINISTKTKMLINTKKYNGPNKSTKWKTNSKEKPIENIPNSPSKKNCSFWDINNMTITKIIQIINKKIIKSNIAGNASEKYNSRIISISKYNQHQLTMKPTNTFAVKNVKLSTINNSISSLKTSK